jgi:hypothetical protein
MRTLIDLNLLEREVKNITTEQGLKLTGVTYFEPIPKNIRYINIPVSEKHPPIYQVMTPLQNSKGVGTKLSGGYDKIVTHTDIPTENSTENPSAKGKCEISDIRHSSDTKANVLSDIDPNTDTNTNSDTENREIFVEPDINKMTGDEFREYMAQIEAEEPTKINRAAIRKKYKADLSQEKFYEFLDDKKKGFNGDAVSVQQYVEIETKLWDHKKRPMEPEALKTKFEKEYWIDHPIAKRFKEMTPEQRSRELSVQ